MPGGHVLYKSPNDVLDYTYDWTSWIPTGDTINTSTWTAQSGITVETSPAATFTNTTTTVWLGAGTAGTAYTLTNQITTTAGRVGQHTETINVVNL